MVWAGIHHDGRTALVRFNGAPNEQIYRDEILLHHVGQLINVAMPGNTPHVSLEIVYSKSPFMSYCNIGRFIPKRTALGQSGSLNSSKESSATNTTRTLLGVSE